MSENISNEASTSQDNESFEKLLDAMQNGEDWAWVIFLDKYRSYLAGMAKQAVGKIPCLERKYGASDLQASVERKFHEKMTGDEPPEFQNDAKIRGFLAKIMHDRVVDEFRKVRKFPGESALGKNEDGELKSLDELQNEKSASPDEESIGHDVMERLYQKLADDEERRVAELWLKGYKIREIENDAAVSWVRRTIERKINKIKKIIKELGEELNNDIQ